MNEALGKRFREVEHRMAGAAQRGGREPSAVKLIAVTKTVSPKQVKEAIECGHRVFGENRVQEGAKKIEELSDSSGQLEWHLIGHLQSNKAKSAVEDFAMIQTVDSVRLANQLNQHAVNAQKRVPVLLEVNVAEETSKGGFVKEELHFQANDLFQLSSLEFRGFMTVAPLVSEPEQVRTVFRQLRELRDAIRDRFPLQDLSELSMGMTGDFEVAVEEGSTMVRIGRALFGDRPSVRQDS
jgi:PLP dependent protein